MPLVRTVEFHTPADHREKNSWGNSPTSLLVERDSVVGYLATWSLDSARFHSVRIVLHDNHDVTATYHDAEGVAVHQIAAIFDAMAGRWRYAG